MTDARSGVSTAAEYADRLLRKADRLEQRRAHDVLHERRESLEAERARGYGEGLLRPPKCLIGDSSTEIVPAPGPEARLPLARREIVDTLARPNMISVDASDHRASDATRAGVLSSALDAAASARAGNSIEKMLCHQLAAVHMAGMELLIRAEQSLTDLPPVERARLLNAAARMFEVYQSGCLTLLKLKAGGTQRIIVQQQQVNVGSGGQAVVAGRLREGSRKRGRGGKNAR